MQIYVCVHSQIYLHTYIYVHTYMSLFINASLNIDTCCISGLVYICMYIHIYILYKYIYTY